MANYLERLITAGSRVSSPVRPGLVAPSPIPRSFAPVRALESFVWPIPESHDPIAPMAPIIAAPPVAQSSAPLRIETSPRPIEPPLAATLPEPPPPQPLAQTPTPAAPAEPEPPAQASPLESIRPALPAFFTFQPPVRVLAPKALRLTTATAKSTSTPAPPQPIPQSIAEPLAQASTEEQAPPRQVVEPPVAQPPINPIPVIVKQPEPPAPSPAPPQFRPEPQLQPQPAAPKFETKLPPPAPSRQAPPALLMKPPAVERKSGQIKIGSIDVRINNTAAPETLRAPAPSAPARADVFEARYLTRFALRP